jgi:hypothetical protein
MGRLSTAATLLLILIIGGPAAARSREPAGFSIGVTGGTLGIGPEIAYRFSETLGVRGNATFLSISHGLNSGDIHYDGRVRLRSGGAMLDFYPFNGGFRVSAGARINGNDGRVIASPAGNVTINGTEYTPAEVGTLRGQADTRKFGPALTLGYGGGFKRGIAVGFEAGALFQDRVRIRDFTSTSSFIAAADLEAERRSVEDDVNDYRIYPIVQLNFGYRF